jgi:hypothetical protein
METRDFWRLAEVSDTRLRTGLAELLAAGYRTEARIIAHLAEVEQRKLHLKDGSASLYDYCTRVLCLSNSEAFHRITAARIARQFPVVFRLIEQRQLHLTAVCLLRDYLTPENQRELLAEASHKTKWQVQELLARRFPRPDVESRVRKLPAQRPATAPFASPELASPELAGSPAEGGVQQRAAEPTLKGVATPSLHASSVPASSVPASSVPAPSAQPAPHRAAPVPLLAEPLSETRYRIQLNASAALKEKLDRLRALTSHSNPSGDIAVVIERALDLALEKVEKQRFAKTNRPASRQTSVQTKLSRPEPEGGVSTKGGATETANATPRQRDRTPNAVLREIAERDGLQCSYRGVNGCRCTARAFLQVHHEWPWARGGAETVDNLRLLCASHNQLLAERDFGARHVHERQSERRRQNTRAPGPNQ